ncbi:MAG: hypothetical protein Q8K85_08610 [Hyphomicrobium sp.]|nr:hypothetical protein [Hyphomicrobium sp.]
MQAKKLCDVRSVAATLSLLAALLALSPQARAALVPMSAVEEKSNCSIRFTVKCMGEFCTVPRGTKVTAAH